jgi:hypothetical protein
MMDRGDRPVVPVCAANCLCNPVVESQRFRAFRERVFYDGDFTWYRADDVFGYF